MDEKVTPQLEAELRENDIFCEWLGEMRYTAALMAQIHDALAMLAAKRTTLEEKIIARELHGLTAGYGAILTAAHSRLSTETQPPVERLQQLRSLNFSVHEEIQKLLRALRHSLNYTEQYFEYDFCARLTNECKFAAEAHNLARLMNV